MKGSTLRISTIVASVAIAAVLSGCTSISAAPAGAFKAPGPYQVTLGRSWADVSGIMVQQPKSVKLLSIDGPMLNRLYLVGGVKPGESMVKPFTKEQPTPIYKAGMSVRERIAFVGDSVSAMQLLKVETSRPRPVKFDTAEGVRFDLTAKTVDGLDVRGTAEVAEADGKLYAIIYFAPAEHYFDATLPEVEKVMASAKLGGKS